MSELVLEFPEIQVEIRGAMVPGRLKMTDQSIVFKNIKTGRVEQVNGGDIEVVNWQRLGGGWGIRIFTKNGQLHRYAGFKDTDQEKIAKFFSKHFKKDMLERELSVKGWNWGNTKFEGKTLSFEVNNVPSFEIPLFDVSQCVPGKNEVALEFHQNDETAVSLIEMRFYIPSVDDGVDKVEKFADQVTSKASVISATGDAIAIFREIACLTPRGRYDIKLYNSFIQLHGKTFDYKIPVSTVVRLFLLPHKDGRQMFLVISLDPPIKQGNTRYHHVVFLFPMDEEITTELPLTDEEMAEKFEGRKDKEFTGPIYEVISKVMKGLVGRKITVPGNFKGTSDTPAIACSYKAAAGYLYPLERGFIYVHKPPLHIRYDEITSVNFARSGGSTRSFDFEIETKSGLMHTFSSIDKGEYGKLYDFVHSKKYRIKNTGKGDTKTTMDEFGDSDEETAPDAYLARVKREAKERDEEAGGGDSDEDESTDEDFNPGEEGSDVAEEYESAPDTTESEDDGSGGEQKTKKKAEKKEKPKKTKTVSEKPRKKKEKKEKDVGAPKRPQTAYFLWLNDNREKIKSENPGISITDLSKKAGELWRGLSDKSEWENKSKEARKAYEEAVKAYKASGGGAAASTTSAKSSSAKSKPTPTKLGSGAGFKSKEYISDEDSDSDGSAKASQVNYTCWFFFPSSLNLTIWCH
ncbi:hypothetical protein QYM36_014097 [Artemia franciscana]|uniref:FACT complex subunit SSRP1 n=1 Tax=Artemia franciscana TaxID=6661 RepID=A0AA88KXR6_ARTSF|nr:hypothetical protein QYM36_014097 [Artemia franciscana]